MRQLALSKPHYAGRLPLLSQISHAFFIKQNPTEVSTITVKVALQKAQDLRLLSVVARAAIFHGAETRLRPMFHARTPLPLPPHPLESRIYC